MDTNDNGYLYHYYRCLYLYIKCSVKLHNELKTELKKRIMWGHKISINNNF